MSKIKTKGIILAGGSGTRLHPATLVTSKQLMPIYDKPMIYYPLSILMLAGIKNILIISTKQDYSRFKQLFGNGSHIGCKIDYAIQNKPQGIAQSFIIGEDFIGKDNVTLILGDNIFYGSDLQKKLLKNKNPKGASIFGYKVSNPSRYGVVEFDKDKIATNLTEKPSNPISNYAVPGLYFYNNDVVRYAKMITPSERGEYEITALNKLYLKNKNLHVEILNRGTAWLDTGTFESLHEASQFIQVIEKRQGQKIGCIEEVAFRMNYINKDQIKLSAKKYLNSGYGEYLLNLVS